MNKLLLLSLNFAFLEFYANKVSTLYLVTNFPQTMKLDTLISGHHDVTLVIFLNSQTLSDVMRYLQGVQMELTM